MQHSLFSKLSPYKGLYSARPENLTVAERIDEQVICLPIYPALEEKNIENIANIIHG